jgi:hypothetical protein
MTPALAGVAYGSHCLPEQYHQPANAIICDSAPSHAVKTLVRPNKNTSMRVYGTEYHGQAASGLFQSVLYRQWSKHPPSARL